MFLSLNTLVTLFEPEKPGSKATLDLTHGNRAESSAGGWPLGVQEHPQGSRVQTERPGTRATPIAPTGSKCGVLWVSVVL